MLLLVSLCPIFSQTSSPEAPPKEKAADPAIYEAFFRQVVELQSFPDHPTARVGINIPLNGEVVNLIIPRIQDVIGLTDPEVKLLDAVATDSVAGPKSFGKPSAMIFEARLQQIESGRTSDAVAQQLKELDSQHDRLIMDHVEQLKVALGNVRFQILDAFVHSSKSQDDLLPRIAPSATPK